MTLESLTYEVLSETYRKEMDTAGLTEVSPVLYKRMRHLFDDANERYNEAHRKDPESKETDRFFMMRKNIRKANNDVTTIRFYKVCKMAFNSALGSDVSTNGLTPEEKELFGDVKRTIENHTKGMMF